MHIGPETIKFPEENIVSNLLDIGLSDVFVDLTPKAKETSVKISKRDYIKLQSFCTVKKTIIKTKKKTTEWRRYLQIQ